MQQRGVLLLCAIAISVSAARSFTPAGPLPAPLPGFCSFGNAEKLLVCGRPLRASRADQFEIELIPGITAKLSDAIIERRNSSATYLGIEGLLSSIPRLRRDKAAEIQELLTLD